MNLYIIESVLCDYTSGMACIAANDLNECRDIFQKEFVSWSDNTLKEFDAAIRANEYKVLKVINQEAGVVSYVCGGS